MKKVVFNGLVYLVCLLPGIYLGGNGVYYIQHDEYLPAAFYFGGVLIFGVLAIYFSRKIERSV